MNKLLLIFFTSMAFDCLFASDLMAQDSTYNSSNNNRNAKKDRINRMLKMEEDGDLIFNKHNIFGIKLSTDGYGVFFEKGKYISNSKTRILQFELNEIRSPKEKRIPSDDIFFGSSVIAYKLNNFFQLKASIGEERLIGGKGNKNGVAVTWLYTAGVGLGILKPYYVNSTISSDPSGNTHQYTFAQILADTVNTYGIEGAAGILVGWGHISLKPGLNAKTGMRFDYARFNTSITAIETGIKAEYYFGDIPMVYNVPSKALYFGGYVTIMFGGRK